jgi:anti-sigma B factor antagonist
MELKVTQQDGVAIVEIVGELDAFNLAQASTAVDALVGADKPKVVLNLRLMSFINSSALGYLIKARKTALAHGGEIVIAHPRQMLRKLLVTLGLDKVYTIFETVEEAVKHFAGKTAAAMSDLGKATDDSFAGANAILFALVTSGSERRYVGRITSLYANGLKFRWDVPEPSASLEATLSTANFDSEIHSGRKLRIKFRQPFMLQDHYFEMDATVTSVSKELLEDGKVEAMFSVRYEGAKPDDLALLNRFVEDLAELRGELGKADKAL